MSTVFASPEGKMQAEKNNCRTPYEYAVLRIQIVIQIDIQIDPTQLRGKCKQKKIVLHFPKAPLQSSQKFYSVKVFPLLITQRSILVFAIHYTVSKILNTFHIRSFPPKPS